MFFRQRRIVEGRVDLNAIEVSAIEFQLPEPLGTLWRIEILVERGKFPTSHADKDIVVLRAHIEQNMTFLSFCQY